MCFYSDKYRRDHPPHQLTTPGSEKIPNFLSHHPQQISGNNSTLFRSRDFPAQALHYT